MRVTNGAKKGAHTESCVCGRAMYTPPKEHKRKKFVCECIHRAVRNVIRIKTKRTCKQISYKNADNAERALVIV